MPGMKGQIGQQRRQLLALQGAVDGVPPAQPELAQQLDLPSVLHRPSCISSTRRWARRHAPLFLFVANRSLSCDGVPTRPIQAKKDFQTNAEPTGKERRTNGRA